MHAAAGGRGEVVDCMQFRAQVCGSLSSLRSQSVRCDVLNVVYSASKKTTSFHSRVSTLHYCSYLLVSLCCSFYRTKCKQSFLKKAVMSVKPCDNENSQRLGFVLRLRDNVTLVNLYS